ncbi:MAG TPA: hypothetical protein VKZ53_23410 [Candidatus Angelobacter sp.]|nr:hypothetical protein [Candidatus Angelobacter sp.]
MIQKRAALLFLFLLSGFVLVAASLSPAQSSKAQPSKIADLEPALRDALSHDAVCTENSTGQEASILEDPVQKSVFRGAAGRDIGVIVTPQGGCHCHNANCATYVYLKSPQGYQLSLKENFESLHPMKVFKHGFPSLTGRFQVSDSKVETTVFDWDGEAYHPSLCATVLHKEGSKLPSIARHACNLQKEASPKGRMTQ